MKNKNSGFSLFTVLISVAFLSIMGLLLLYISVANFQMQTTDLKGTDSFYTAEQALEEIRTGLQEVVGDAMSEAYIYVMENYSVDDSVTDESLDDLRHTAFTERYLRELTTALSDDTEAASEGAGSEDGVIDVSESATQKKKYSIKKLEEMVDLLYKDSDETGFDSSKETLVITNPSGTSPEMEVGTESGVLLKNIKVIYVDSGGHSSIIQTDIRLGIPNIEFPTPSTLPDLMNMIVVADGGLVCESGDDANGNPITIDGSVYAGANENGVSIQITGSQGMEITGGDQVVCEGEVQVNAGSNFTSSENVALWASGITLSAATVKLLGKTYIADDLTVESGSGSSVTISGEYYGYGSPDSARASHNNYDKNTGLDPENDDDVGVLDGVSDASLSSSIIINGKNTTLDLSGVQKLMLAGRTYVGGYKLPKGDGVYENAVGSDILMGESLTVKGTQVAYLLPSSLLKLPESSESSYTGTLTNPMTYTQYEASGISKCETTKEFVYWDNDNKAVSEWGNRTLSEIGVDFTNPVTKVFYNDASANNGGGYVYFYLNFASEDNASSFMKSYYQVNDKVKKLMDTYLSFYLGDGSITVKDSDDYLRLITAGSYVVSGNIFTYSTSTGEDGTVTDSGNLLTADADESEDLSETQTGYQNMWYALNRKMIGSYDLLETEVKNSDDTFDHNEASADQSVFDNLVNEDAMVEFIYSNPSYDENFGYYYEFTTNDESGLRAIFVDNGSGEGTLYVDNKDGTTSSVTRKSSGTTFTIDKEAADTLRLVVCTGDVTIETGVAFQGIIMAKGKITLEEGASLTSTPIEAAKVFQAQMAAVNAAPRDFFWDGSSYVLGSSSDSDSTSSSSDSGSDTYDISTAITYENWKKM